MTDQAIPAGSHEPGVYFGMSDEEYHADPALGSTNLRLLKRSPEEFHAQWCGNPNREEEEDKEALIFGTALHDFVLGGLEKLEKGHMLQPSGEGMLVSQKDMQAWLKDRNLKVSGSKEELVGRIRAFDKRVLIYDEIAAEAVAAGKRIIKPEAWARIRISAHHIIGNPKIKDSFKGGFSEISVFWIEDGIRYKCRFDYLKTVTLEIDQKRYKMAVIPDLKSFTIKGDMDPRRAVNKAAENYVIQACHYLNGLEKARPFILRGKVFNASDAERVFLAKVALTTCAMFCLVFYKKHGYAYSAARTFRTAVGDRPESAFLQIARDDIREAVDNFRKGHSTFGAGLPWVNLEDPVELHPNDVGRG